MTQENVKKLPPRVIQHMVEFDNTCNLALISYIIDHPGVDPKDLIHLVHDTVVSELNAENFLVTPPLRDKIICSNCGLTDRNARVGYTSRVKIAYLRHNNAIWELGGSDGPWLLRDEINVAKDSKSVDYSVQKFLRDANIGIPLVEMYRYGGGDEKFNYTMMSRAKGKTLEELHGTICDEQYGDLMFDLIKHIKNIRQFTSPHMQRVDGGKLLDNHIGNCYGFPCVETGRNEEEWLENLTPAMRKSILWELWRRNEAGLKDPKRRDAWVKMADAHIVKIKANFPKGGPYVLTHGDLNNSNIFGSNDNAEQKWKITAIIDWETAGYFPWWVELVRAFELLRRPKEEADMPIEERQSGFCPPEFNKKDWQSMLDAIRTVADLWFEKGHVGNCSHGNGGGANNWYTKEFCECHKIRKQFIEYDMGWPQEHHDAFDPELTDPDDDKESTYYPDKYNFDANERGFMRWFKSISS
ncbi:hypothetical protein BOTCAL_0559g00030 [Botryotinia calthae]|uniref:Aminoglycoside phosphotransferase domain-containing protein n=1 Tax=Botryotinia calthae TaxID=38488 RepID=A0A4Y8CLM5_9HELO|nr:hypothetical protein BOTCAL_0559g00030 [Botryotinia calthae]